MKALTYQGEDWRINMTKLLSYQYAKSTGDSLVGICYLSGGPRVCPKCSECWGKRLCYRFSGRLAMPQAVAAGEARTRQYLETPSAFYYNLSREIKRGALKAAKKGVPFAARLNGCSDIDHTEFIRGMPSIQFYDYTKVLAIALKSLDIPNYDVTFSFSGFNLPDCFKYLAAGGKVAVVTNDVAKLCRERWFDIETIDGDCTDERWKDKGGVVVALKAKGKAKKSTSPFIWRV